MIILAIYTTLIVCQYVTTFPFGMVVKIEPDVDAFERKFKLAVDLNFVALMVVVVVLVVFFTYLELTYPVFELYLTLYQLPEVET